jgi:hypothetical protein
MGDGGLLSNPVCKAQLRDSAWVGRPEELKCAGAAQQRLKGRESLRDPGPICSSILNRTLPRSSSFTFFLHFFFLRLTIFIEMPQGCGI